MTARSPTKPHRSGAPHKNVVLLPRTAAGRALLRSALPLAHCPNRPDGELPNGKLPDGSSIYGLDFDAAAEETERDLDDILDRLFGPDQGGTR